MSTIRIPAPEGKKWEIKEDGSVEAVDKEIELEENEFDKYPTKLEDIDRPYYIDGDGCIWSNFDMVGQSTNHLPTKKRTKEIRDLIKLISFRDGVWAVDDWKPDWGGISQEKWSISFDVTDSNFYICLNSDGNINSILNFKSRELAKWFLEQHEELIEKCKYLIG